MYLGVDIGGTNGRVVAFTSPDDPTPVDGENFSMTEHTNEKAGDFKQDFENLVGACMSLMARHAVEAIGVGLAGKLNLARTALDMAGNIHHWVNQPVKAMLENWLQTPVFLGNDAEAAALAEAKWGLCTQNGYRGRAFLGIIWGSGVGGACVRPLSDGGLLAIPGEYGHVMFDPRDQLTCRGCDESGHIEAIYGGNNIPRWAGPVKTLLESDWLQFAEGLCRGIRNVLCAQPVDLIVMSGGVICSQAWLVPEIERMLDEVRYNRPQVRLSAFGESAGSKGALALLSREV